MDGDTEGSGDEEGTGLIDGTVDGDVVNGIENSVTSSNLKTPPRAIRAAPFDVVIL